jgi:hypothetical protein
VSNARATPGGPRPSGGRRHGADHGVEVPSITSAPEPLEEDQARRTRRYLVQMGIRVVCFLGAIAADGWVRWTLVVLAVVLPYSAVLFANAGRDRVTYDTSPVTDVEPTALPAPDPARPEPFDGGGHRVVEHEDDAPPGLAGPTPADEKPTDKKPLDERPTDEMPGGDR